jgi:hypothetical protein
MIIHSLNRADSEIVDDLNFNLGGNYKIELRSKILDVAYKINLLNVNMTRQNCSIF